MDLRLVKTNPVCENLHSRVRAIVAVRCAKLSADVVGTRRGSISYQCLCREIVTLPRIVLDEGDSFKVSRGHLDVVHSCSCRNCDRHGGIYAFFASSQTSQAGGEHSSCDAHLASVNGRQT